MAEPLLLEPVVRGHREEIDLAERGVDGLHKRTAGVALLLNRGFCGSRAVLYHLNRGLPARVALKPKTKFWYTRAEVVLTAVAVFKERRTEAQS